jgi:hypothetical protein
VVIGDKVGVIGIILKGLVSFGDTLCADVVVLAVRTGTLAM